MTFRKRTSFAIALIAVIAIVGAALALSSGQAKKPNIIFMLLDTTRADHVGSYGYPRNTTPHLDAFASEFNRCAFAVSTAPWTPTSVLSILSGMYSESHGYFPPPHLPQAKRAQFYVPQEIYLLPEFLQDNGYATAGVSANAWISKEVGFSQGFDRFFMRSGAPATVIGDKGRAYVQALKGQSKPFFLYLHFLDPHHPYKPPKGYDIFKDEIGVWNYDAKDSRELNRYDGEIRFMDREVGKFVKFLKQQGLFDDAVIFIVSDHGEQFSEHGYRYHANQVYNTESHVPLLFKLGKHGPKHQIIDETVSTIDIFATLAKHLSLDLPKQASLSVPLTDKEAQKNRAGVFTAMQGKLLHRSITSSSGNRLVVGSDTPGDVSIDDPALNVLGVFNARTDHFEQRPVGSDPNLSVLQEHWRALMEQAQKLHPESNGAESENVIPEDAVNRLRSLGYL